MILHNWNILIDINWTCFIFHKSIKIYCKKNTKGMTSKKINSIAGHFNTVFILWRNEVLQFPAAIFFSHNNLHLGAKTFANFCCSCSCVAFPVDILLTCCCYTAISVSLFLMSALRFCSSVVPNSRSAKKRCTLIRISEWLRGDSRVSNIDNYQLKQEPQQKQEQYEFGI